MSCLKEIWVLYILKSKKYGHPPHVMQPPPILTQYEYIHCHINMLLHQHTDREMFLRIRELIDKFSRSLGGDYDGIDRAIGNILNKVIVGVNKGSKVTCN